MRALLLSLSLAACAGSPAPAPPAATAVVGPAMDLDNPQACAGCHAAVVEEWSSSMHAQAHHTKDPVHGAMRALRMDKQGEHVAGKCAQCHTPRDPGAVESAVAKTGVSCATCHNLDGVDRSDGKKGAKALVFAEPGVIRGPHGATGALAPHAIGPAQPALTDGSTVCLACHDKTTTPAGLDACTTGPELASAGDASLTCTGCHMPEVDGASGVVSSGRSSHRSHAFLGAHQAWTGDGSFVASAVDLTAALDGGTLTATLSNQSGHGFPTGFPGRMAVVLAVGVDASGAPVWRSFTTNPMAEDPQAVLNKVYVDDAGAPTMPPFAAALKRDSRLRPGETRSFTWEVPETVVRADVKLVFRLLPPPAAAALGLTDAPEAQPKVIATVSTP